MLCGDCPDYLQVSEEAGECHGGKFTMIIKDPSRECCLKEQDILAQKKPVEYLDCKACGGLIPKETGRCLICNAKVDGTDGWPGKWEWPEERKTNV